MAVLRSEEPPPVSQRHDGGLVIPPGWLDRGAPVRPHWPGRFRGDGGVPWPLGCRPGQPVHDGRWCLVPGRGHPCRV